MLDLTFPKQVKILVYDTRGQHTFIKLFAKNSYKIISSNDNYNLFILLKTISKFKLSFSSYLEQYIAFVKPILLISNIDNEPFLWNYKYKFKNLTVILIQFAVRSRVQDLFGIRNIEQMYNREKALIDYFFVFNTNIIKEYQKLLDAKFIPIGSIINNDFVSDKCLRNNEISFISQYRPNQKIYPAFVIVNEKKISKEQFYNTEKILLPILLKFCNHKFLKLSIIGCSSDIGEVLFYDSILGKNNYIFYPKTNMHSSYEYLTSSLLNVCVDSTLGYESFSRGIKTIFISNRANDLNEVSAKFGWPGSFEDIGEFWLNGLDECQILDILEKIFKMDIYDFQILQSMYSNNLMSFNLGNDILKEVINTVLIENH